MFWQQNSDDIDQGTPVQEDDDLTICGWIRTTNSGVGTLLTYLSIDDDTTTTALILLDNVTSGVLQWLYNGSAGNATMSFALRAVNTWQFVAITKTPDDGANVWQIKTYNRIDTKDDGWSFEIDWSPVTAGGGTWENLRLGTDGAKTFDAYGHFAHLKIFKRALTSEELFWESQRSMPFDLEPAASGDVAIGLIGWWPLVGGGTLGDGGAYLHEASGRELTFTEGTNEVAESLTSPPIFYAPDLPSDEPIGGFDACVDLSAEDVASIEVEGLTSGVIVSNGATITPCLGAIELRERCPRISRAPRIGVGLSSVELRQAPTKPGEPGTTVLVGPFVKAPLGAVELRALAPAVRTGPSIGVGLGAVELEALAPTVVTPCAIRAPLSKIEVAGLAPSLPDSPVIGAGLGAVEVRGFNPCVKIPGQTGGGMIMAPLGSVELRAQCPRVRIGTSVGAPLARIELRGQSAVPVQGTVVGAPLGSVEVRGFAPQVSSGTGTNPTIVSAPTGKVELRAFAPMIATGHRVHGCLGVVELRGQPARVVADPSGGRGLVSVPLGSVEVRGLAPCVKKGTTVGAPVAAVELREQPARVSSQPTVVGAPLSAVEIEARPVQIKTGTIVQSVLGDVEVRGLAPCVKTSAGMDVRVQAPLAHVEVRALVPTIAQSTVVAAGLGEIEVRGRPASVSGGTIVHAPAAALELEPFSPALLQGTVVRSVLGHVEVREQGVVVVIGPDAPVVEAPLAHLEIRGFEPCVQSINNPAPTGSIAVVVDASAVAVTVEDQDPEATVADDQPAATLADTTRDVTLTGGPSATVADDDVDVEVD